MIVITSENGYQIQIEIRNGHVILKANTTERMHVSNDDARTIRWFLEHLA